MNGKQTLSLFKYKTKGSHKRLLTSNALILQCLSPASIRADVWADVRADVWAGQRFEAGPTRNEREADCVRERRGKNTETKNTHTICFQEYTWRGIFMQPTLDETLTFSKCRLIHRVKVLFCTTSLSTATQKEQRKILVIRKIKSGLRTHQCDPISKHNF